MYVLEGERVCVRGCVRGVLRQGRVTSGVKTREGSTRGVG